MKDLIKTSTTERSADLLNMTEEERSILVKIRNKKFRYIISTYATLTGVLLFAFIRSWSRSDRWGQDEVERFAIIAPYFYAGMFLLLTIFFSNYYLKLVHPFVKDIKKGMKEAVLFNPGKYQTPFFNEYFLVTPIKSRQRIKVSKEFFDAIQPDTPAFINKAVYSGFIFSIHIGSEAMFFNESNTILDK